jgi:hypothetical protein
LRAATAPFRCPSFAGKEVDVSTHQTEESGTFFVLPPQHRLFVVFDDPVVGSEVAAKLRDEGVPDDVWTFFGDMGIQSVDPRIGRHGVLVAIVRVAQRLMTNDCEYCDGLSNALGHGAMVLAVRAEEDQVEDLSERLRELGGHTFAYGEHWNFVPLGSAGRAIGFFSSEGFGAAEDTVAAG